MIYIFFKFAGRKQLQYNSSSAVRPVPHFVLLEFGHCFPIVLSDDDLGLLVIGWKIMGQLYAAYTAEYVYIYIWKKYRDIYYSRVKPHKYYVKVERKRLFLVGVFVVVVFVFVVFLIGRIQHTTDWPILSLHWLLL